MDFVWPAKHGQLYRVTGVDEMRFDASNVKQLWRVDLIDSEIEYDHELGHG